MSIWSAAAVLRQHGECRVRLLSEGGPTLNQRLLDPGLIDELFWTVAPKLAGGCGPGSLTRASQPSRSAPTWSCSPVRARRRAVRSLPDRPPGQPDWRAGAVAAGDGQDTPGHGPLAEIQAGRQGERYFDGHRAHRKGDDSSIGDRDWNASLLSARGDGTTLHPRAFTNTSRPKDHPTSSQGDARRELSARRVPAADHDGDPGTGTSANAAAHAAHPTPGTDACRCTVPDSGPAGRRVPPRSCRLPSHRPVPWPRALWLPAPLPLGVRSPAAMARPVVSLTFWIPRSKRLRRSWRANSGRGSTGT